MAFEPPRAKKEVWERRSVVRGVVRVGWGRVGRMNARICVLVVGCGEGLGGGTYLGRRIACGRGGIGGCFRFWSG